MIKKFGSKKEDSKTNIKTQIKTKITKAVYHIVEHKTENGTNYQAKIDTTYILRVLLHVKYDTSLICLRYNSKIQKFLKTECCFRTYQATKPSKD